MFPIFPQDNYRRGCHIKDYLVWHEFADSANVFGPRSRSDRTHVAGTGVPPRGDVVASDVCAEQKA